MACRWLEEEYAACPLALFSVRGPCLVWLRKTTHEQVCEACSSYFNTFRKPVHACDPNRWLFGEHHSTWLHRSSRILTHMERSTQLKSSLVEPGGGQSFCVTNEIEPFWEVISQKGR
eukprot:1179686-Prymnesium_polylepis.1